MQDSASPISNGQDTTNSITLSRGQKGTYAWEIKLRWPTGAAAEETLWDLAAIDSRLKSEYPTAGEG